MKFFVFFVVFVFAIIILIDAGPTMHNPYYCYATDTIRSTTNMAAQAASYEAVLRFNFTTFNPYLSTCTPSRFWYLGRYATRVPLQGYLQSMIDFAESSIQDENVNNYAAGRTTLCRQDFKNIRDFSLESDIGDIFRIEPDGNADPYDRTVRLNISNSL